MGAKLDSSLVKKGVVSPDPTAYTPNIEPAKTKAPQFRIGTSARGSTYDERKAKFVPAPGTYDIKSQAFADKPRSYIGQKLTFDDTAKYIHSVPGPGTHNPTP